MDKLLTILIDYFEGEGQTVITEKLIALRNKKIENVETKEWNVGDKVRLKKKCWNRSRGVKGTPGEVVKVNPKNLKVIFEGEKSRIWNVSKTMLEHIIIY